MVNEIGGMGEGMEFGGQPREDLNKVTEEAVRRVQDQSQQAKQTQQQIKQDKVINASLAQFLSYLLKHLTNEKLVHLLYELFFKTKNPTTGVTYFRKKINSFVIVGLFYPFYRDAAKEYQLDQFYISLLPHSNTLHLQEYVQYIKKLSHKYHDNIPLDPELFLKFLSEIIQYFDLYQIKELPPEKQEEFFHSLRHTLYS